MNFNGCISKHLYERIQKPSSNIVSIPLDEQELKFLDFCQIQYKRDNKNNCSYIVNLNELRKRFCNR